MSAVWASTIARLGVLLAIGPEPGGDNFNGATLVIGGAEVVGSTWQVRLRQTEPSCFPYTEPGHHEASDMLIPGTSSLIIVCGNGGSGGGSRVLVLGAPLPDHEPELLMKIDCGQTDFTLGHGQLVIESRTLAMGLDNPPEPQPDVTFVWNGTDLVPEHGVVYEQPPSFCDREA